MREVYQLPAIEDITNTLADAKHFIIVLPTASTDNFHWIHEARNL